MRDSLGETPAVRAAREAKEQADATKAENAKTAKEENAKKRKADALETKNAKKAKVAAAKAESRSASSSTKAKPKPKAKAKAKAKADDNQSTLSFSNAPVASDEFAEGLTELFKVNEGLTAAGGAEAGQGAVAKDPKPKHQCSEGEDANAASAPTVANDGEIAGAVDKDPESNAEERVSQDGSGSEYEASDEEDLPTQIEKSKKFMEELKITMSNPDTSAVDLRDATRLYADEQKHLNHLEKELVTMAEALEFDETRKSYCLVELEDLTISPERRARITECVAIYDQLILGYKRNLSLCPTAVQAEAEPLLGQGEAGHDDESCKSSDGKDDSEGPSALSTISPEERRAQFTE
jgi:hypothetical protein